eukprot:1151075-Pelagomonas_calceolata.AAC.2
MLSVLHPLQGIAAIEEVCDPSTLQRECEEQSQFQLVAGHQGIRCGSEKGRKKYYAVLFWLHAPRIGHLKGRAPLYKPK